MVFSFRKSFFAVQKTTLTILFSVVLLFAVLPAAAQIGSGKLKKPLKAGKNDSTSVAADSLKSVQDTTKNDTVKVKDPNEKKEVKSLGSENIGKTTDSITYAANTVGFIYRFDLMKGLYSERRPDTTLTFKHRYNFVAKNDNLYQDLGNSGSAMQAVFDRSAPDIGNRWGQTAFEPYITRAERMRYFNTLSPFTDIYAVFGGQGRSFLSIEFARNINPEWSFSVLYRTVISNYVVYKTFRKNDNQIRHQTVGFATRYFTPKRRYKLLAHYLFYNHKADETAGLRTLKGVDKAEDLFKVNPAEITMRFERETVNNLQYGHNFHIFQQLNISKDGLIALFHSLDYSTETRRYNDKDFQKNKETYIYDSVFFDGAKSAYSYYENLYSRFANKAGIMGSRKGFAYAFFASMRSYSYSANFMEPDSIKVINEKFDLKDDATVGGSLRYDRKENMYASVGYEKLLGKDYVFSAEIVSPYVTLQHKRMSYAPSAVQRRFFGNHFRWTNDYENTLFSTTSAVTKFSAKKGMFVFEPTISYSSYQKYVYFDTLAHIKQSNENVDLLQAGLDFTFKREAILVKMKTYYTQSSGADVIRVPQIFSNLTVMLDKKAYKNALHYQIGADIHFRSKYFADDYNPFLMQFFMQNKEKTSGFPVTDIFFNFKVKRFIAFLKVNNVAQDLFGPGYFVTPYYMGQPRSLEIGMNWLFYD